MLADGFWGNFSPCGWWILIPGLVIAPSKSCWCCFAMFCGDIVFSTSRRPNKVILLVEPYIFSDSSREKQARFMDEDICDVRHQGYWCIVQKRKCSQTVSMCYQLTSQECWENSALESERVDPSLSTSAYWCSGTFPPLIKQLTKLGAFGGSIERKHEST